MCCHVIIFSSDDHFLFYEETKPKKFKEPLQEMSSRKRIPRKIVYKMTLSVLFRKTKEYHVNELKLLFQKYNQPVTSDEENKIWTSNMSESTLNKLRLHLSWAMGLNTFEWDRQNVGEQTVLTLKQLGLL